MWNSVIDTDHQIFQIRSK